ncbi:hypothetical protein HD806DRAFT_529481 [Xylariaceae sp. AK1471]|nr:hypothetical protein HD806DRAFT_529481 [Xylariaceae sp. AK1471]
MPAEPGNTSKSSGPAYFPRTHVSATKPVAKITAIKKEFISHADPFLSAVGASDFDDEDQYEDGDI